MFRATARRAAACLAKSVLAKSVLAKSVLASSMLSTMSAVTISTLVAAGALPSAARADAVADFYKGKQMRFIIRSDPGGSYDLYSRMIGRYIVKYIPGHPTMLPVNMPGGGGLLAINHIAQVAPKDGTILTIPSLGLPMYQAIDFFGDKLKADMGAFNWVGNVTDSNPVLVTWHASKVKTLDDAKKYVAFLGTTGAGSISAQLPAVYNNLLGTKFKVIYGYGGDDAIAMERGEVDGRATNTWSSYKSTRPDWVQGNKLNYLLQIGLKKEPELPNVPLLMDLATNDEQKQIFSFFSTVVAITRPVATSPDVPADRVAALRKAFMETMKDKEFLDDAAKQQADVSPMSGEEVQRLIQQLLNTPKPLLEKVKAAMTLQKEDLIKYEKKK
jgi:tripartite-type tricarboxylate transporter receptor subunit TctC